MQTDEASARTPPALFQSERLDEEALRAIHGKGGAGIVPQPLINLSIILWDEPGHGGSKPQALAGNNFGGSARGVAFNGSNSVSIGNGK